MAKKDSKVPSYYELMNKDNKAVKKTKKLRRKIRTDKAIKNRRQLYEEMKDKEWTSAARSSLGLGLILAMVLTEAFPKRAKEIEELMKDDHVTLAQRAKIACILGKIDKNLVDDLMQIHKIRNKFAHTFDKDFAHKEVIDLVKKLSTAQNKKVTKENSYVLYESAVKECAYKMGDIINKLKEENS